MKLEKKIAKLLNEHELSVVIEQLIVQAGMAKVLLQISNRLCFKSSGKDAASKAWLKRAKAVHSVMQEIEAEEKLEN